MAAASRDRCRQTFVRSSATVEHDSTNSFASKQLTWFNCIKWDHKGFIWLSWAGLNPYKLMTVMTRTLIKNFMLTHQVLKQKHENLRFRNP